MYSICPKASSSQEVFPDMYLQNGSSDAWGIAAQDWTTWYRIYIISTKQYARMLPVIRVSLRCSANGYSFVFDVSATSAHVTMRPKFITTTPHLSSFTSSKMTTGEYIPGFELMPSPSKLSVLHNASTVWAFLTFTCLMRRLPLMKVQHAAPLILKRDLPYRETVPEESLSSSYVASQSNFTTKCCAWINLIKVTSARGNSPWCCTSRFRFWSRMVLLLPLCLIADIQTSHL